MLIDLLLCALWTDVHLALTLLGEHVNEIVYLVGVLVEERKELSDVVGRTTLAVESIACRIRGLSFHLSNHSEMCSGVSRART